MERDFVVVKFEGDLKDYRLLYDFNHLVDAEAVAGCNLMSALVREKSATEARGILYSLLKTDNPDVTLEEAGSLFTRGSVPMLSALRVAVRRGLAIEDDPEEMEADVPPAPAPGAASPSATPGTDQQ